MWTGRLGVGQGVGGLDDLVRVFATIRKYIRQRVMRQPNTCSRSSGCLSASLRELDLACWQPIA